MKYSGVALSSLFSGGRKSVVIEIFQNEIVFSYDEEQVSFSLHETKISTGGAGNRLIYFTHPHFPEISFYTSEKQILKNEFLTLYTEAKKGLREINKKRNVWWAISLGILFFFVLLIVVVFALQKKMVSSLANQVPPQWEKKVGDQLFSQVTMGRHLIEDSTLMLELKNTLSPLVKAVEDTSFKFQFFIIEDPTLNAFALPGGNIVIHSELILKSDSWEELLGVLAHEISHVTRRHHVRGIITNMGIYVVLSAMVGDATALLGTLAEAGGSLQSLMYSREYELESDESGWNYLVKANINPNGMITFFKKLQKEHPANEKLNELSSFLSTHPATEERIENLSHKKTELKNQNFSAFTNSFNTFKTHLKIQLEKK